MKRTELVRKTPLKAKAPMKRTACAMRQAPLKAVSAKRVVENRERAKMLAPRRAEQTWCAKCGRTTTELDGHELLSRGRRGSITDASNVVLICRFPCHDWITTHPTEAEAQGWALKTEVAS